jgi:hypothetical protein
MLPLLKVPVAMNCCVEPTDTVGVVGVTVIDTNPVGVRVPGRYNSALARAFPVLSEPPATSTFLLFSNVAVCPIRSAVMLPVTVKVPVAGVTTQHEPGRYYRRRHQSPPRTVRRPSASPPRKYPSRYAQARNS